MNAFVEGFIKGARETPRGFFSPAVAIWRLMEKMFKFTDSVIASKKK